MAFFLLLIIVAIALGIVGVVVKGLFFLLIIGVVLVIADLVVLGARMSRDAAARAGDGARGAGEGRPHGALAQVPQVPGERLLEHVRSVLATAVAVARSR